MNTSDTLIELLAKLEDARVAFEERWGTDTGTALVAARRQYAYFRSTGNIECVAEHDYVKRGKTVNMLCSICGSIGPVPKEGTE